MVSVYFLFYINNLRDFDTMIGVPPVMASVRVDQNPSGRYHGRVQIPGLLGGA